MAGRGFAHMPPGHIYILDMLLSTLKRPNSPLSNQQIIQILTYEAQRLTPQPTSQQLRKYFFDKGLVPTI
jgi:hypothetical protein